MTIEIQTGHDLSDEIIDMMNQQRVQEYEINTKNFRQNEQDSTFFFLRDGGQVTAFGMLKPITLIHQGQMTTVLGIGNIIARDKSAGNGKQLMLSIKAYLDDKQRIGLGFCNSHVAGFYRKCGYQVLNDLPERFRYPLASLNGEKEKLSPALNSLCHDPIGGFIEALQSDDDHIYINQPFW